MSEKDSLCLWLVVDSLLGARDRFAIWVLRAPYPGGHVHYDCPKSPELEEAWNSWQSIFAPPDSPEQVPHIPPDYTPQMVIEDMAEVSDERLSEPPTSYAGRYMQDLGVKLWQWLFDGPVSLSFERSQGIAIGKNQPLRLRLEIRDPELIALPWEIMQSQVGRQALALNRKILLSRTSSDVDRLEATSLDKSLKVLLVIGRDSPEQEDSENQPDRMLRLGEEATLLKKILEESSDLSMRPTARRRVDVLLQPSAAEMSRVLERGDYNVFFYAGHGVPGPDGGLLFLSEATLSGTELAQVLTRAKVKLAVFNTCWGARSKRDPQQKLLPRSSLAEVLLHHGLPAVVAMRDPINDEEAISFIQVFAQALAERKPVDEAVAIARQHLLTVYRFTEVAWTLPVLYMHPDYNGALLLNEETTQIEPSNFVPRRPRALLRDCENPDKTWPIYSDVLRIGRRPKDNDLVISDLWVSSSHAEIFHRRITSQQTGDGLETAYFLRDNSRYGTFYLQDGQWREVHRQEITLSSGTQIRFGNRLEGKLWEFVIKDLS